jgi:mono/diheme cytochrome c family protein
MLRGVDTVLKLVAWFFTVFFVTLLFVGPQGIAEDRPDAEDAKAAAAARNGGAGGGAPTATEVDGQALFSDNCGSCHTLSAADTSGSVGPNLDGVALEAAAIEGIVRDGRGSMPPFGDKLSADEISAIAQFVAGN